MGSKEERMLRERVEKSLRLWGDYPAYRMRKRMKMVLNLIDKWYPDGNKPKKFDDVLEHYEKSGDNIVCINYGYTYYFDELKKFKKNPESLWELYDHTPNKSQLFETPFLRYTPDEKQNTEMFLRDMFYNGFGPIRNVKLSPMVVDLFDEQQRKDLSDAIVKAAMSSGVKSYIEDSKNKLVQALIRTIRLMDELGVLEQMRETHNSVASRLGLEILKLPVDAKFVDGSKILGINIEECSVFQLEAMLCFYSNRLEKVREEIGLGLFALRFFVDSENYFDIDPDLISDRDLLGCQVKYDVWTHIFQDMLTEYHNLLIDPQNIEIEEPTIEEAYDIYIGKYEDAYAKVFAIEKQNGDIVPIDPDSIRMEYVLFAVTNSCYRFINYLTKTRLMEDLILQAEREGVNWGIMEDDKTGYNFRRNMLIGIDVPGLNMPLRLHYPLDDLRILMHDYLKTDEVPLYVGGEDFDIHGEHSGTQFVLPITQEQKKAVRKMLKMQLPNAGNVKAKSDSKATEVVSKTKSKITADSLRRAKHIACMQLPNITEKLLAMKTGKTQRVPDYMNIFTGRIRLSPRRNT